MRRHINTNDWEAERAQWVYVSVSEERTLGRLLSLCVTAFLAAGLVLAALMLR